MKVEIDLSTVLIDADGDDIEALLAGPWNSAAVSDGSGTSIQAAVVGDDEVVFELHSETDAKNWRTASLDTSVQMVRDASRRFCEGDPLWDREIDWLD